MSRRSHPSRWRFKHGAWYYRVPAHLKSRWDGKTEFRLGKTTAEAYRTWYERVGWDSDTQPLTTVNDMFERYLVEILPEKADKTQRQYREGIKRLRGVFGDMFPESIEPKDMYRYMDGRPPVTANRDKAVMSAVLSKAVRWGMIRRNPIKGQVERNPERPKDRYVEDWEVEAFLEFTTPFLRAWIGLKRLTGIRQGQMRALKLSDWDAEKGILSVDRAKGGRRNHYFGDGLEEAMSRVLAIRKGRASTSEYLFATRNGTHYSDDGFSSIWHRSMTKYAAKTSNERFTENDLRAKVASDSHGIEEAQKRLGHQDSKTTQRHYRRGPQHVEVLHPDDPNKRR